MTAGNTYYIVIDGWGGEEGNYVVDFYPYDPLLGYTIWNMTGTGDIYPSWSSCCQAIQNGAQYYLRLSQLTEPCCYSNISLPGIFDPVNSDPAGPVAVNCSY